MHWFNASIHGGRGCCRVNMFAFHGILVWFPQMLATFLRYAQHPSCNALVPEALAIGNTGYSLD